MHGGLNPAEQRPLEDDNERGEERTGRQSGKREDPEDEQWKRDVRPTGNALEPEKCHKHRQRGNNEARQFPKDARGIAQRRGIEREGGVVLDDFAVRKLEGRMSEPGAARAKVLLVGHGADAEQEVIGKVHSPAMMTPLQQKVLL